MKLVPFTAENLEKQLQEIHTVVPLNKHIFKQLEDIDDHFRDNLVTILNKYPLETFPERYKHIGKKMNRELRMLLNFGPGDVHARAHPHILGSYGRQKKVIPDERYYGDPANF